MDVKTTVERLVVTFVESFLATWATYGFHFSKVVFAGVVGAAASVAYNVVLRPLLVK